MTPKDKKPFAPKDAETLKQEIIKDTGLDYEDNKEVVDKMINRELKNQELLASFHKSKEDKKKVIQEQDKKLKELEEAKKQSLNGDEVDKRAKQIIAEEMFLQSGRTKTDLRHLKQVMTATGKDFYEAQRDIMFTSYIEKVEREQTSRDSQLPPSRGGSFTKKTEKDEIADKNMGNLPPGFSAEAPKK